ncbi:MAG: ABC transporter permease [Longimicrobiales bacterium]
MSTLIQDVRYGLRMLARTPIVSIVAALSLALGITAATAMFALASAFFLEPLPFAEQDRLVLVRQLREGDPVDLATGLSMPNFRDLEAAATTLSAVTAYDEQNVNVTGVDRPERIEVVSATPNFFEVLGVVPALGRGFRAEEGAAGTGRVLVLTHAYWTARFLSDPGVVGRSISLDGQPHTIIGVMAEDFEMLPATIQALRATDFAGVEDRARRGFIAFGRLRAGATHAQAESELTAAFGRLVAQYPDANRSWRLLVQEARAFFPGPTDTKLVLVLVVVALFGVCIACANVANLLLARAEARMKEVAVRTALGAGRARLVRQLLTESVLLSVIAGALGTLFSVYAVRGFRTAMPPVLPDAFLPELDIPTLAATLFVALGAGILFGIAPAVHATRANLREILGEGSRGGTASLRRKRLRSLFVIGEVAIALALLTGSAFLLTASDALINADQGFDAQGLLTFQLTLPEHKYADAPSLAAFTQEATRRITEISGVEGVAVMTSLPRGFFSPAAPFHIEGTPEIEADQRPRTGVQSVNPGYFATMGVPLLSGRSISEFDRANAPPVAVVSRGFAERWFPAGDAIGKRLDLFDEQREIVGIAEDILQSRIPLGGREEIAVYLPFEQRPLRSPAFTVRSSADATALAAELRRVITSIDPDQPIAELQALDAFIRQSLAGPRVLGIFALSLGILAMILSAIGIYGVMAHNVVQATREIGIRMAIGARQNQVVGMITRQGLLITGTGLVAGLPLALLVRYGVVRSLNLFEVSLEPNLALGAAAALAAVALLASWLPARRAARVQPVKALQGE